MKALLITLPKKYKWSDYELELETVKDGSSIMSFKLSGKPKINVGDRCYICHDGYVKGWMSIVEVGERKTFNCTTTGKCWETGYYVSRSGKFHYVKPVPQKGFQGFRYVDSDDYEDV